MYEIERSYIIDGRAVAWARPRCNKGRFYDSQEQEKENFKWELRRQKALMFYGAVKMEIEFIMPIPSYTKKKVMETVAKPHNKRPDLDNLVKFVLDACLGILYEDDNIVCEIVARKIYGLVPCTRITIGEIDVGTKEERGGEPNSI